MSNTNSIFARLEEAKHLKTAPIEEQTVSSAEAIEFLSAIRPGLMACSPAIIEELRTDLQNYLNRRESGIISGLETCHPLTIKKSVSNDNN